MKTVTIARMLFGLWVGFLLALPCHAVDYSINYSYDDMGRLIGVDYVDRGTITYSYDKAGNMTTLAIARTSGIPGDIDGDDFLTLTDVVLGLQLMTCTKPVKPVTACADVDGNNTIGMEEILYTMQQLLKQP